MKSGDNGASRISVLAVGKAAPAMARAAATKLGSRIRAGLVIAAEAREVPDGFEGMAGGHPVPTAASEEAGRKALALARATQPGEQLLVLLSGGASALMAAPADGITLEDKQETTRRLLRAGADIHSLNTVRKHLSAIKGGQFAAAARAACRTLAISDVVGDDPSVIGSGPTVSDESTFADARGVLERFGGAQAFSPAVTSRLARGARGEVAETPKANDPRLGHAAMTVIGGRHDAMRGAAAEAAKRGYYVVVVEEPVVGDARGASREYARTVAERARSAGRPLCVVSSGETTVHVKGHGRGGRNQEFALGLLAAAESRLLGDNWALASAGTDGIDGPTDAAGALVDSRTRSRLGHLDPARFLDANDSYNFFASLNDLILTGPTGTNVGDLQVFLAT